MEHRGIYNRTEIDKSLERNRNKKASLSEEKQRRHFVVNGNVSRETLKYGCVKLVKEHLHGCADFLRIFELRKMPGVGDGAGLDCWVTFSIFFDCQVDIRFGFAAENVDAVVDFFQSLCNITFCVVALDAGVDRFRGVAEVGGLMVFVDVVGIHIVRVIEVTLGEGLGDYTSCGCKIVEKCSDDREIKDKLITFCGFSRNMTAGEERIRVDEHHLLKEIRIVSTGHCHDRSGRTGGDNICAAADLGFYEII